MSGVFGTPSGEAELEKKRAEIEEKRAELEAKQQEMLKRLDK